MSPVRYAHPLTDGQKKDTQMRPKYLDVRFVSRRVLVLCVAFAGAYALGALMMATMALLSWEWTKRKRA